MNGDSPPISVYALISARLLVYPVIWLPFTAMRFCRDAHILPSE